MQHLEIFDEGALVERLSTGIRRQERSALFLVGSPISAPSVGAPGGVPDVNGVISLIREEFAADHQEKEFDAALSISPNRYQAAFSYLHGRRGQQAANDVIKKAVWKARITPLQKGVSPTYAPSATTTDAVCRSLDSDLDGWLLPPAVASLGRLLACYPNHFGPAVLTTNFDPLIEVAIGRAGGHHYRTVLHGDGNLGQTHGDGCHVIHLHGYWHGSDTLHTPRQLLQPRPRLKASLSSLVRDRTLVVCGYGGWDDAFTDALMSIVVDDTAFPEILWCMRSNNIDSSHHLATLLAPGLSRGRVTLYGGIDCSTFFPRLERRWQQLQPTPRLPRPTPIAREPLQSESLRIQESEPAAHIVGGEKEDQPPLADFCVGRDNELQEIQSSSRRICFITGFGGQGKSTLAARYFLLARDKSLFDLLVWRDCKEESERFENQIISVVERLSKGEVSARELSGKSMDELAEILRHRSQDRRILFVFDNVDHYVDLENDTLTGNAEKFVEAALNRLPNCRLVFTCRPKLRHLNWNEVLTMQLEGLSLDAANTLFASRQANAPLQQIERAHALTQGHAFWLDLIAAQVAKDSVQSKELVLRSILDSIEAGGGELPTAALSSIWATLQERQKTVLMSMAETVRPATDNQIADYLADRLNFNQVNRALTSLRKLNLVVVKPQSNGVDALELHPLVREFVRRTFPMKDRLAFLNGIISVYLKLIGAHKSDAKSLLPHNILTNWTDNAELYIAAGKFNEALECLADVAGSFYESDMPGEFARVASELFRRIEWGDHSSYKSFDSVVTIYIRILVNLGRREEYERLLDLYGATMASKDSRYINYCDLRCHAYWTRREFEKAIEWGEQGQSLKKRANTDTKYDTDHNLALARRDGGQIDAALSYFLQGLTLEAVLDIDEVDDDRGGPFYGNIGRCLHLMGQIDPAIVCYRKSGVLLQRTGHIHVENQGFIRAWIGELLVAKKDYRTAYIFLLAARHKWATVSPTRILDLDQMLDTIGDEFKVRRHLQVQDIERFCLAWLSGREADIA